MKLKPLIVDIEKRNRVLEEINRRLLTEEAPRWGSVYFVIGPDGEFHSLHRVLNGISLTYHGDVVRLYPKLYKEALAIFDNREEALRHAISKGKDALYDMMYDAGCIRGGPSWVAFNSKHVSTKALMTLLAAAKVSGKQSWDVDDVATRKYELYNLEDFIDKFVN